MSALRAWARVCLKLGVLAALAGTAVTPVLAQELTRLDALLAAGDSVALVQEFRSGRYEATALTEWLTRRAEEGHAVPQYELAERLKGKNLEQALSWYARGRLTRLLDEEECSRAGRNYAALIAGMLDFGFQDLDTLAQKNEPLFAKGMQGALAAEAREPRISAAWICGGEANLLPRTEAQAARAKVRERLERRSQDIAERLARESAPVNPDGFRITTLAGDLIQPSPTTWLDNDHLLFASSQQNDPVEQMRVWNVASGVVALPEPRIPRFYKSCYFEGYIWYAYGDGPDVAIKVGPLGKEKEIWRARVSTPDQPAPRGEPEPQFHPITCRPLTQADLADPVGRTYLLPEHGVLRRDNAGKLVFYRLDSGESTTFPYDRSDFGAPRYAPFLGGYYMSQSGFGRAKGPRKVLVLYPDGRSQETVIPYGPWHDGSTDYVPTRQGIFMWSHSGNLRDGVGTSGGYLIRDEKVTRLIAGWPGTPIVSPDGCRVAMSYSPPNRGRIRSLSVIDVCARGT